MSEGKTAKGADPAAFRMLYEGRNLISERPVVVLDIGKAYTKCGFAGESGPRCIIPTEFQCKATGITLKVFDYKTPDQLFQNLVDFVHILFFKYLLVTPKDRKVVIVESLLSPSIERDTLAKVLFNYYELASVCLVPSHMVSLYTLAVPTALVLDIGYKEAILIPVVENTPVLHAYQALAFAGEAVENNLKKLLESQCKEEEQFYLKAKPLPSSTIEDIKVRGCFVTRLDRAQMIQASLKEPSVTAPKPPPELVYPLGGERSITVPGTARELAYEVLFELDNDLMSIATMILDAILKCPVDTRVPLAENIVLIGGTSMALGLKARLQQELQDLLVTPQYIKKLALKTFCFHSPPAKENYVAWLGGAIMGATNSIVKRSVLKEDYQKLPKIPDWADLSFNCQDSTKRG
ncbi:actin-related protein 10 [Neocloeon triangulifer]|uniref:actin-related protein 10 n=1 Tax=Neocloeon triangulifer TaxID=2078957 RepID=UPI00286EF1F7|nr:actin-related protein 10 [Neocloeon triangulifer]